MFAKFIQKLANVTAFFLMGFVSLVLLLVFPFALSALNAVLSANTIAVIYRILTWISLISFLTAGVMKLVCTSMEIVKRKCAFGKIGIVQKLCIAVSTAMFAFMFAFFVYMLNHPEQHAVYALDVLYVIYAAVMGVLFLIGLSIKVN